MWIYDKIHNFRYVWSVHWIMMGLVIMRNNCFVIFECYVISISTILYISLIFSWCCRCRCRCRWRWWLRWRWDGCRYLHTVKISRDLYEDLSGFVVVVWDRESGRLFGKQNTSSFIMRMDSIVVCANSQITSQFYHIFIMNDGRCTIVLMRIKLYYSQKSMKICSVHTMLDMCELQTNFEFNLQSTDF